MRMIHCRSCDRTLTVDQFYPSDITPGTVRHRCKSCTESNPKRRAALKNWRDSNKAHLKAETNLWRSRNPEKWKVIAKRSRLNNIDKVLTRNRQREIREYTAMPHWADRKKIDAIYLEAKRLTRETGVRYEVDHFYPLRGEYSCGLHVEYNLRIITATENRRKFNKMPEEITC